MAVAIGKLNWFRGDSYPIRIQIKDSNTELPIDLTGYLFKFTVNQIEDPSDIDTQLFTVDGILDADPTTGFVSFTPTETDTSIVPGDYFYDIQMITDQGHKRTIHKNSFIVSQDITK